MTLKGLSTDDLKQVAAFFKIIKNYLKMKRIQATK